MNTPLRSGIRTVRQRLGMQQQELANRIGVSRQTLSSIEAGTTVPSTLIALSLARVLNCRVEDLFSIAQDSREVEATFLAEPAGKVSAGAEATARKMRVALAQVGQRWVARSLDSDSLSTLGTPADGLVSLRHAGQPTTVRVQPLRDTEALRRNLLVAGCDPALGLLGRHLEERLNGPRLHWIDLPSHDALDELAGNRVHIAGLHLDDLDQGNLNAATVRRRFGEQPMVLVTLASWELGIVCRPDQAKSFRSVPDFARQGVRVIGREPGAGAQQLLESALKKAKLTLNALNLVKVARGHRSVAQMIANRIGDVGVATRAAASPLGLAFVPIAEARFDIAFPAETASDSRMQAFLDCLASSRFRRDLGAMTGYRTNRTGSTVQETSAEKGAKGIP